MTRLPFGDDEANGSPYDARSVVAARIASFVALFTAIPSVIVSDVAASAFPATGEIVPICVVRRDPICALVRRTRPIAVVPRVVGSLRILVALDPDVIGCGWGRHAVRAWSRRFADANPKVDLRGRR
jgi:hypothetical protein